MNLRAKVHSYFLILLPIFLLVFISPKTFSQEINITPYLIKIEAGKKAEVIDKLPELKQKYPNSSEIIYLEGLLTEDGEKAFRIYSSLLDKYPKSKYADDSIYRIYSYFIAVDKPGKAEVYLNRLQNEHPESPYLKVIKNTASFESKPNELVKKKNDSDKKSGSSSTGPVYLYTIQAGAFSNKENALRLKSDFENGGYSSEVKEKSVGGSLFHVVFVGKFKSETDAKSKLDEINSKFKVQGWVVKLN